MPASQAFWLVIVLSISVCRHWVTAADTGTRLDQKGHYRFLRNSFRNKQSHRVLEIRPGGHSDPSANSGFEIVGEKEVYNGWRTITKRSIRLRNGKVVDFDLVGVSHSPNAVLVFAWDTQTKTATMVREYMPGSNKIMWGLAAGIVEEKHGNDILTAAQYELEEECHLVGGTWIPLCTGGAAMDKYSTTSVWVYLVLDATKTSNPKPLDEEEDIEIVPGVKIEDILRWVSSGEMNLVSAYGAFLAIQRLKELGEHH